MTSVQPPINADLQNDEELVVIFSPTSGQNMDELDDENYPIYFEVPSPERYGAVISLACSSGTLARPQRARLTRNPACPFPLLNAPHQPVDGLAAERQARAWESSPAAELFHAEARPVTGVPNRAEGPWAAPATC